MIARLILSLLAALAAPAAAADVPAAAVPLIPVLRGEIAARWPDLAIPSALAAQVEQETCISLKSKGCWNPRTELKTSREYGFGLGQLTVTSRFNAWDEVRGMDAGLRDWRWEDRYDARLQLRALVVKDRFNARSFATAATPADQLAFAFAAYNGGIGGALSDIKQCRATTGCDPGRWFGHVERTSLKARAKVAGYGQSFFDINRGYVRAVLIERRLKYIEPMGGR
ncbi:MAG: lytic murein transglycosylase [Bacteroidota bacterium]